MSSHLLSPLSSSQQPQEGDRVRTAISMWCMWVNRPQEGKSFLPLQRCLVQTPAKAPIAPTSLLCLLLPFSDCFFFSPSFLICLSSFSLSDLVSLFFYFYFPPSHAPALRLVATLEVVQTSPHSGNLPALQAQPQAAPGLASPVLWYKYLTVDAAPSLSI